MNKLRLFITVSGVFMLLFFAPWIVSAQAPTADITPPSDVENVKASAGDRELILTWSPATDDVGVIGYKIYYGFEHVGTGTEASYSETLDVGNVSEFTLKGLGNDKPYYLVVTAYDASGNESEFYSSEASATPKQMVAAAETPPSDDVTAPTVSKAEAPNKETVKVVFSEAIKLPEKDAEEAFTIQNSKTLEVLEVMAAMMDPADTGGKTVLLTTQSQTAGTEYILTAGVDIEDKAGNPIVSGTSDTAIFSGSGIEKPVLVAEEEKKEEEKPAAPEADTTAPSVKDVVVLNETTIEVSFTEPVTLNLDPSENFSIAVKDKLDQSLKILAISVADTNDKVTLTTEPQKALIYALFITGVADIAGNALDTESNKKDFQGLGPTADVTPPENVTDLVAKILNETAVRLNWKASANTAGDLFDQLLYMSGDLGQTYGTAKSMGKDVTASDMKAMEPGKEYYFKVTTKDAVGNESSGTVVAVKLPETGMGIGLLAVMSLAGGSLFRRKQK